MCIDHVKDMEITSNFTFTTFNDIVNQMVAFLFFKLNFEWKWH